MKTKKHASLAFLLCFFLVLTTVAGCKPSAEQQAVDEEVIKLGFLGATTGEVANYGVPGKKGMVMAIDELNDKGGILGKKVVGVYEDNKGDQTEIATIATRYVTRDKVAAMVGDPCTGLTKVAAKIAQDNKVVIFSAGATGTEVVEIGDYVFRNTLLDMFAVPAVVDWMISEKGWKNIAVITSLNNGYSTALTPVFKKTIKDKGAKIVIEQSVNDGETDFTAQITRLKNARPDVLVFTGYYKEAALLMLEAKKQGLDINLIGGDGLYGLDLYNVGKEAVDHKVIFYCGFSSDQPSPESAKFIKDYQERYKEMPDMFSAQYYDAVMILAKAMEGAQSSDPSVFKNELAKLKDYPGVSGNTTFRADREPIKNPVFLQTPEMVTKEKGKFVLVDKLPVNVQ